MPDEAPDVAGLPVGDAVEVVLASEDAADRGEVREALDAVAEDGVVRREAVDDALTDASMAVATAENRTEFAGEALAEAREAADDAAEFDAVAARLDDHESRFRAIETDLEAVQEALGALVEGRGDAVYEVGRAVRRVTADASSVQQRADELQFDLDDFERWVASPDVRYDEFEEDLDALAGALDRLADATDELADVAEETADDGGDGDQDPGLAWADLTVRHRVNELLVADLRAELAEFRAWAAEERDGRGDEGSGDESRAADLEARLDDAERDLSATGERLADLARPAWTDRFGDRVAAVEEAFEGMEPPVDWGAVEETLDDHGPA